MDINLREELQEMRQLLRHVFGLYDSLLWSGNEIYMSDCCFSSPFCSLDILIRRHESAQKSGKKNFLKESKVGTEVELV